MAVKTYENNYPKRILRKPACKVSTSNLFYWVLTQTIMAILSWFGLLKLDISVAAEPNVMVNHH